MLLTWDEVKEIVENIEYKDWTLQLYYDSEYTFFLQWVFVEDDEEQFCRKWIVDTRQPKSDIVRTAIFAAITAEEHEVREKFRYKGKKIFNPHFDVDRLVEVSGKLENLDIPNAPVAQ